MLIVAGLFLVSFSSWRGRAFILAIRASLESRNRRITLTNTAAETPDPFCTAAPVSPPPPAAAPTLEEVTEETPTLTGGISQIFARTAGSLGGERQVPGAAASSASSVCSIASMNATTSALRSNAGVAAPASASCAPVSSTPPITQCASLVREFLQPSAEAVAGIVLPRGAGTADAADHGDDENVSLMRTASGFCLDGATGGGHGGSSTSTPTYGSTLARPPEFGKVSSDDGGNEEPRREPGQNPRHDEEQPESRTHRFLHGASRLMHKISEREDHHHAGHTDTEDIPRVAESSGKSTRALRFLHEPSHLMHKIAREHDAHGGDESITSDDAEAVLRSAKGSSEPSDRNSRSHKWHRPHWHQKHDNK